MFEGRPWAEEVPRIRMKMLKQLGIFKKPNKRFGLSLGNLSILVVYNDYDKCIDIVFDDGMLKAQKIPLEFFPLKYGNRPYFFSEISGVASLDIYLHRGYWDSLFGHRLKRGATFGGRPERWRAKVDALEEKLVGAEGYGRPRGNRRQRLAEELLASAGGTHMLDSAALGEIFAARDQARKLRRRVHRFDCRKGPLSTFAGAKAGMSASIRPEDLWVLGADMRDEARTRAPQTTQARFAGPVAFVEDHPVLDGVGLASLEPLPVPKLPPRLLLGGHLKVPRNIQAWGVNFRWPQEAMGNCHAIQVAVEKVSDAQGVAQVRVRREDGWLDYEIELQFVHYGGRTRWYFICPVSGKRCDRLFFRGGRFASAAGQRLVHKSQRVVQPAPSPSPFQA